MIETGGSDMTRTHRIVIVEDEMITSMEIQDKLERLGCKIVGVVVSGEESLRVVEEVRPDLVLMDIGLKGEMDGIEAARLIRERWGIPVIFISAYSDDLTMQKARATDPYIYLVKPFTDKGLETAVDFAVYWHRIEQDLKKKEQRLSRILDALADGVVVLDEEARIVFMNRGGSILLGQEKEQALGRDFSRVVEIVCRDGSGKPVERVLSSGEAADLAGCMIKNPKLDGEVEIEGRALPMEDDEGKAAGAVLVFRKLS